MKPIILVLILTRFILCILCIPGLILAIFQEIETIATIDEKTTEKRKEIIK